MPSDTDTTAPGARFPHAAAAFCAACIAAAVWTFMLYSYAWHADWDEFRHQEDWSEHALVGRYVAMRAKKDRWAHAGAAVVLDNMCSAAWEPAKDYVVPILGLPEGDPPMVVRGRVSLVGSIGSMSFTPEIPVIDTSASRWTGASVAGLVVGAMGVLIFALHLRRWLRVSRLGRAEEESTA